MISRSIDLTTFAELSEKAALSERGRANLNFHPQLDDPVQRFLNAIEPGSYVRPHRHVAPAAKWELFVLLAGAATVLIFDQDSTVLERIDLDLDLGKRAVEVPPGVWHTVFATESGTVLFEFKQGPYAPLSDKDFAPWAPLEGEPATADFLARFASAAEGERIV